MSGDQWGELITIAVGAISAIAGWFARHFLGRK